MESTDHLSDRIEAKPYPDGDEVLRKIDALARWLADVSQRTSSQRMMLDQLHEQVDLLFQLLSDERTKTENVRRAAFQGREKLDAYLDGQNKDAKAISSRLLDIELMLARIGQLEAKQKSPVKSLETKAQNPK